MILHEGRTEDEDDGGEFGEEERLLEAEARLIVNKIRDKLC